MSWLSDLFGGGVSEAQQLAQQQQQMIQAQEDKRQADITAGKTAIDSAFSQFTDPYYDTYKQTYLDNYNPQLTDQFGQAKDQLTATLAGADTLDSSVGANALARLAKTYNDAQSGIANQAQDATNAFKSSVQNAKTNLYTMNESAADPSLAASQAQASAGTLVSPASLPSLGSVFGNIAGSIGTANQINSQSMNPWSWNQSSSGGGGSSGSSVWGNS